MPRRLSTTISSSKESLITPSMSIASVACMRTRFFGQKPDENVNETLDTIGDRLQLDYVHEFTDQERETYLESVDTMDLLKVLEMLNKEVANFRTENLILTDFLEKNDPKLLVGLQERRESMLKTTTGEPTAQSRGSSSARSLLGSRSLAGTQSTVMGIGRRKTDFRLNYRTKSEMAEKLAAEIERRIRELETREMQNIKMMNAEIEELALLYEETVETTKNFKLHFLQDERDLRFLEIATERQLEHNLRKFVNNWLKNARGLLSTMHLKSTTLQEYCKQLRGEYITKSDLSGILSAVDFEQLIIKRDQLLASLEEKNTDMAGLKGVTGTASMAMAHEKQLMMSIEDQTKSVAQKTTDVMKAIAKLQEEKEAVQEGNEKDTQSLKVIKQQLMEYEAPSINDYINKKMELLALEKEEKMMNRKVNIQSLKLSTMLKRCKNIDFSQPTE